MKRWMLVICAVLAVTAAASAWEFNMDNSFVDMDAGMQKPAGDLSTWQAGLSYNQGMPLYRDWGLGAQLGASVTLRDDEPDWLGCAGLFQRGSNIGGRDTLWGLQGFWVNTHYKADLAFVKPSFGMALNPMSYCVLSGIWGKNEESLFLDVPWLHKQEGINEASLVYGRQFNDNLSGEFLGGYQFSAVDEPIVGTKFVYRVNDALTFNVGGVSNFAGEYNASAGLGWDLGRRGRTDKLTRVSRDGDDDYTPLPIGNLSMPRFSTVKLWR